MWLSESEIWQKGAAAEAAGDTEHALALYSDLFGQVEMRAGQVPSALVERMADCCRELEKYTQSLELFLAARDGMLEVGDDDGARRVTIRMAVTLLEAGRFQDAVLLLRSALDLGPEEQIVDALSQLLTDRHEASPFAFACAEAVARWLAATGRYQDAISILRRALATARKASHPRAEGYELFLAELLVDSGLFAEALAIVPNPPSPRWHLIAARAHRFMGELGPALSLCELVREARVSPVLRSKAALLHAAIFSQLNRLGAAVSLLQMAAGQEGTPQSWKSRMLQAAALLALRRQEAQDAAQLPLGLDDLWAVAEHASRPQAAPAVEEASEFGERYADRVAATLNRASQELARGRSPVDTVAVIQALRDGCDSRLQQQRLWAGEAWIRYYSAQYGGAEECWQQALELARDLGTPLYSWEAKVSLSWCAAHRDDLAAQEEMARDARHDLESIATALDAGQRRHFLLNKVSARDEYLALEARSIVRVSSPVFRLPLLGQWLKRRYQRKKTRDMLNRVALLAQFGVAEQLKGNTWRTTAETAVTANQVELLVEQQLAVTQRPASKQDNQRFRLDCHRRLNAGEAMVQYLPLPDQLVIVWATRHDAGIIRSPVTRPELDSAVRDCLKAIIEQEDFNLSNVRVTETLRRLSGLLAIEALSESTKQCSHWFIAPPDVLVNVPFAALSTNDGAFLIESRSISLIPNPAWLRSSIKSRTKAPKKALVVGCSIYPESSQLSPLPNARREAAAVAQDLSGRCSVTSLLDLDASEQRVVEHLEHSHIAHFACHGEVNADAPLASCLRFSVEEEAGDRLTAQRLYGLNLSLRVAVLAACRASALTPLPDNDLVGIPAAFLYAGTESVIAPLWEISDELSESVMRLLHRGMLSKSAAEALRIAQCARCRADGEVESRVFNWGAYTCFSLS